MQKNRQTHRKIQGDMYIYLLARRLSTVQKEEKNSEDRRSKKKLLKRYRICMARKRTKRNSRNIKDIETRINQSPLLA